MIPRYAFALKGLTWILQERTDTPDGPIHNPYVRKITGLLYFVVDTQDHWFVRDYGTLEDCEERLADWGAGHALIVVPPRHEYLSAVNASIQGQSFPGSLGRPILHEKLRGEIIS